MIVSDKSLLLFRTFVKKDLQYQFTDDKNQTV